MNILGEKIYGELNKDEYSHKNTLMTYKFYFFKIKFSVSFLVVDFKESFQILFDLLKIIRARSIVFKQSFNAS